MIKHIMISLFTISCYCLSYAQCIGINTRNTPTGMLVVVDGSGDNSLSPSGVEIQNDVVINAKGNVGIGMHNPLAKLSIDKGNASYPIRIIDGYQEEGRMLTSDDSGNANWLSVAPSTGSIEAIISLPTQNIAYSNYTIPLTGSEFVVPTDGYYIYEVRWYGKYSTAPSSQLWTTSHFRLTLDNNIVDEYEAYMDVTTDPNDAVAFFTALATKAQKGQRLALINRLGFGPGNTSGGYMQITDYGTGDPRTSKIIVKRLNMR